MKQTVEDMKSDGTLQKLSMKWFEFDLTSPDGLVDRNGDEVVRQPIFVVKSWEFQVIGPAVA